MKPSLLFSLNVASDWSFFRFQMWKFIYAIRNQVKDFKLQQVYLIENQNPSLDGSSIWSWLDDGSMTLKLWVMKRFNNSGLTGCKKLSCRGDRRVTSLTIITSGTVLTFDWTFKKCIVVRLSEPKLQTVLLKQLGFDLEVCIQFNLEFQLLR